MITKDLPIFPRFTRYDFLSRCKFSTLTTLQPMVEFYLLTFSRFPLRKKKHKSYFGKNRTHDFRTRPLGRHYAHIRTSIQTYMYAHICTSMQQHASGMDLSLFTFFCCFACAYSGELGTGGERRGEARGGSVEDAREGRAGCLGRKGVAEVWLTAMHYTVPGSTLGMSRDP